MSERKIGEILDWQRRFNAGPVIWVTMYRDAEGLEEISNVYESREAAQTEIDWAVARGKRGRHIPRLTFLHIHSLALAQERWRTSASEPPPGVTP